MCTEETFASSKLYKILKFLSALKEQLSLVRTLGINDNLTEEYSKLNNLLSDELPVIGLYRKCSAMFIRDHYHNIKNTNHLDMFTNIAEWEIK